MGASEIRVLTVFPEPEFTALRNIAFKDFGEPSTSLSKALAEEARGRPVQQGSPLADGRHLRLGAFLEGRLVGWSYSCAQEDQLRMVNSGVLPESRRRGIYSGLVRKTIDYAASQGFSGIVSRHVPGNNAVIIPKLRLGFVISAFEYSEVYGPLVHLTYLCGKSRRALYQARSRPIVPAETPPGT